MNKKQHISSILAICLGSSLLSGQTLLYEFRFNDPANDTSTVSTASSRETADFTNPVGETSTREPVDLHSPNSLGISSLAGDYAFDNTGSSQMGGSGVVDGAGAGYGGLAQVVNGSNSFDDLQSFTVQGWYNGSSTPQNYARLIQVSSMGVWFQGKGNDTTLQFTLKTDGGRSETFGSNDPSLREADAWIFFAFTYDGTTGTTKLYGGTDIESVELIDTGTLSSGYVTTATNRPIGIGNSTSIESQRPFDGLLDNFRIWGEDSGSSGALDLALLERVRIADLNNSRIPKKL